MHYQEYTVTNHWVLFELNQSMWGKIMQKQGIAYPQSHIPIYTGSATLAELENLLSELQQSTQLATAKAHEHTYLGAKKQKYAQSTSTHLDAASKSTKDQKNGIDSSAVSAVDNQTDSPDPEFTDYRTEVINPKENDNTDPPNTGLQLSLPTVSISGDISLPMLDSLHFHYNKDLFF
ncbi:hypothetical protein BDQ17DRAFT_1326722 [Cyathus striatus]|nr:hypothetical protein BDQ17DRAFT_1326722 [Cyathus striatus]